MNLINKSLMTYISPDGWYALSYPKTWEVEADDQCSTFNKSYGGVGVLQISAYETGTPQSARNNLEEYMRDEGIECETEFFVLDNEQRCASCSFETFDSYTKVWFLTKGEYLLFVTYTCDPAVKDVEAIELNNILQSVRISQTG